jgi:ADP-ribose pyrophosphatase YjhB (NUDIX family)
VKRLAVVIIEDQQQQIYLQLRDNKPGIGHPDHWGLFGGTIEAAETPADAAVRELSEELAVGVELARLSFLGRYAETPTKFVYAFRYQAAAEMQAAVLHEGQRIGCFARPQLETLSAATLESHPIVPIVWQILQAYFRRAA